jgi:hypothetical protein
VFAYDAGAELPGGTRAPALRIGLFATRNGPAPWLLDASGRALFAAAVECAAAGRVPA